MPVKSEAQRRFMYAASEGKVKDVPKKVGEDFINASHGQTNLPERLTKLAKKRAVKSKAT